MALTEPDFIERDAEKITAEMIAKYEADTGKTLYPAQAERLLIDLWAYREMLVRVAVQEAAKQNLVNFSREPMIDYLGELVGVYRLAAQPASTPLQFAVDEAMVMDVLIPAGTRVSASDSVIFATDTDVVLKAGLLLVNVTATCTEPGDAGNGWQPAQVSQLLDEIDNVDLQVTNLSASSGGSEQEDNDRLRERIRLAPESFTNAGSRGAYRFHAMGAHPSIVDVAVLSPVPGTVELYPLLSTGLPDDSILTLVESFCSDEKVRPLTDTVHARKPVQVDYAIDARITVYRGQDVSSIKDAANNAIQRWVAARRAKLGLDIVPGQINAVLSVDGVYQVELPGLALVVVAENEWANCTSINITMTGLPMAEPLQLPPPLEGDISLRALGRLAGRLDNINLESLMVYLVDIVDSSALPWLGEQFSLFGDGWELAESDDVRRALIKSAIELHRYKGTPWSIREIIRRFGFSEVDLIEGTGQIGYDGRHTYNGNYVHGDAEAWAVYRVILRQPITNDQAALLRQTLAAFAPARCHLASLEYQSVAIRYNNTVNYDGSYNHGSS